ncbi:MAG: hypothetical protein IPK85_02935 [Gemmatimonadetes bacterium]|nr:hypothetical protein [Gemmatimonadota bacterium]
MASYEHRVVTVERHEWVIPTYGVPGGVAWAEAMKAIRAAHQMLWDLDLYPIDKDVPDDVIRIQGDGEGSVVVSFTLERSGDSVRVVG